MSTCTCYRCDGLGSVADGLDQFGDARDRVCSHCRGTGQEPEDLPTEPAEPAPTQPTPPTYAERTCCHCKKADCRHRGDPGLVFCWINRRGEIEVTLS